MERAFLPQSCFSALLPPDQDSTRRSICERSRGSRDQLPQLDGRFCGVRRRRGTTGARRRERTDVRDTPPQVLRQQDVFMHGLGGSSWELFLTLAKIPTRRHVVNSSRMKEESDIIW